MEETHDARRRPFGAVVVDGAWTEFRVWAPSAASVAVRAGSREHPLERESDEVFAGRAPVAAGKTYRYVLDGGDAWPDPCSRAQPEGIRGPSQVVDTRGFEWRAERPALPLEEVVLYEVHVGTFSDEGTLDGAIPHLRELAELGVTAVEVMPVATFAGERGWGYDGLYTSAVHPAYGGPHAFARFVDAAHAAGLAVVLDVVYNHVGPGNEALRAFGPYFTDRHETFWGDALDFSESGVREWAIGNAELWVGDFRVDGLRLDAVHAVFDDSSTHVLAELAERVRAIHPGVLVTDEMETGDLRPIEEWGHDAQWADELHHELHVLLTGEREGYYADYGSLDGLAGQLRRTRPERLIVCSQNHDQVGNRALGDRPADDELRVRAAVTLFAPQTPLLFQGEEYGERRPFLFFSDHIDPAIAEATREGRRREFAAFAAFTGSEVPDPQAEATFLASKLDRSRADGDLRSLYRELLALRRELPRAVEVDVEGETLRLRRGPVELRADFAAKTVELRR